MGNPPVQAILHRSSHKDIFMSICLYAFDLVCRPVRSRQRGEERLEPGDIRIGVPAARELLDLLQRFDGKIGAAGLPEQPRDEDGFRPAGAGRTGFGKCKHFFPNRKLGDDRTHAAGIPPNGKASAPLGHPAHGRYECVKAGLLACGSSRPSRLPGVSTSGIERQKLAVHSCGGSAGLAAPSEHRTGFPLSLRAVSTRKTLTPADWPGEETESTAAFFFPRRELFRQSGVYSRSYFALHPAGNGRRFTKTADEGPCCASRPCRHVASLCPCG